MCGHGNVAIILVRVELKVILMSMMVIVMVDEGDSNG